MTSNAYEQPPKKSISPWVWVGIGCGVMVVGVVAFVAFLVFVVGSAMRSSTPYKDSIARAQTNPRVIALLGAPVKPGYFFTGSINTTNDRGNANLVIRISGPKGKGSITVVGTKKDGAWSYETMKVIAKGTEINLLEESPGTAPPTS